MTSQPAPHHAERPPVKKRGRFALAAPAARPPPASPLPRRVADGFVRDELDDDDSSDDPDFAFDLRAVEPSDDDDVDDVDDVDDFRDSAAHPFDHAPGDDDHHFEVDSLDSTDEEPVDPDVPLRDARSSAPPRAPAAPLFAFGDLDLSSEDSDADPDFRLESDAAEPPRADADVDDADADGVAYPPRDEEYVQFLMGLLADNGSPDASRAPSAARGDPAASDDPARILDDDDDFDYLRESAMVQDDPLEFRDDLHVSRKEVAQLLFSSTESNLRRHTRTRAKQTGSHTSRRPRHGDAALPLLPAPLLPLLGGPAVNPTAVPTAAGQPLHPSQHASTDAATAAQRFMPAAQQVHVDVSPAHVFKYKEQLGVFTQILTHLHAVARKKARVNAESANSQTSAAPVPVDSQSDPVVAARKSEALLRRLQENKRVSTAYHQMIQSHVKRLKGFSERLLHRRGQSMFNYETSRSTIYDSPAIDLIQQFLRQCETDSAPELPESALRPFEPYCRQDVAQALVARPNQRQYTMSGAREGWYTWTTGDDALLAMTIAKYGREFGDYSSDLLPHRLEEDCQARVRYLASRRCPENPVKRQVVHITTPLNRDELKLVEAGLQRFGGNVSDSDVWKRIQRELLPTREWSHLQKLWLWRETRRKYKATYRAKVNRKKALEQGTVVA